MRLNTVGKFNAGITAIGSCIDIFTIRKVGDWEFFSRNGKALKTVNYDCD